MTMTMTTKTMTTKTMTTTMPTADDLTATRAMSIDMMDPGQACRVLGIDDGLLLALVNQGHLAAYNFDGQIRFRVCEIAELSARASAQTHV